MSTDNRFSDRIWGILGINTRRRNFFIKKRLQSRFIIGFAAIILLGFVLNLGLAYFLIDRELGQELFKIHLKIQSTEGVVAPVLWRLGLFTVPAIILISSVAGWRLIKNVELPLMNFREAVSSMGSGDLTVRLTDEKLETLPAVFNSTMDSLGKSFGSLGERIEAMERASIELKGLAGKGAPTGEIKEVLKKFSLELEALKGELSSFRL